MVRDNRINCATSLVTMSSLYMHQLVKSMVNWNIYNDNTMTSDVAYLKNSRSSRVGSTISASIFYYFFLSETENQNSKCEGTSTWLCNRRAFLVSVLPRQAQFPRAFEFILFSLIPLPEPHLCFWLTRVSHIIMRLGTRDTQLDGNCEVGGKLWRGGNLDLLARARSR